MRGTQNNGGTTTMTMLPAKRRARILQHLREETFATLGDLSERLDMSVSTIRRDVEYLDANGHLVRTRGGAMLAPGALDAREMEADISAELEAPAKRAIGRAAAALIPAGATVIFDSGSTTAAAARAAAESGRDFSAVTNDLAIAGLLSAAGREAEVTGGRVRPGSSTLLGAGTAAAFGALRADLAFVGAHAVAAEGMSDTTSELAHVKTAILGAARRVVLLADASKFDMRSFRLFGRLEQAETVISDARLPLETRGWVEAAGPKLILVEPSTT